MTVKEIAKITGRSTFTVRRRIGDLYPAVRVGKGKKITLTDEQAFTTLKSFQSDFRVEEQNALPEEQNALLPKKDVDYEKIMLAGLKMYKLGRLEQARRDKTKALPAPAYARGASADKMMRVLDDIVGKAQTDDVIVNAAKAAIKKYNTGG
jgi:hypothetical protein